MTQVRWEADSQRIVGIGASAGGLDALKQLVAGLPRDSGLSFVILQHLPPAQTGVLATLLAPVSPLPVSNAMPQHRLAPDSIVIVPPLTGAEIHGGAIELRPMDGGRAGHPIDLLFSSLAQVAGDRAIGIVLSGTGYDGTYGLRQILAAGGSTVVQEPATAQFDDMPRNAIAMNAATLVLAPGDIGRELASLPARTATRRPSELDRKIDSVLLARYAPAAVVVDEALDVVQFRGRTGPYLEPPPGPPQQGVLAMARAGIAGELRDALERAKRADVAVRHEGITLRDGHEFRTVNLDVTPVRTVPHGPRHFLVVFESTMDELRASRAARDQATAIVEAVPTPLVVVDGDLQIVSFNRAFADLFGGRSGDVMKLGRWHVEGLQERLLSTLRTGDGFDDLETEYSSGDRTLILQLAARRLPGAPQLLIGIADIGPLREAEQAREANRRERDAFLGAVSHELRTPLSAIMLWTEALRGFTQDDPRRADAIGAIVDATRSETQLVDDLLDLALSRTDGLGVVPEVVDGTALVRDVLANLSPAAAEKQLVLESALGEATLIADPRRLRQIVTNLVGNAIKFTPPGGTITVSLEYREHSVVLRVHDTGAGLPPDAVAHAFEPFWQADGSTTRTHGGLGIGLALVRHLVDRHGGTIAVASDAGHGTTFTVHFPMLAAR
jgi:signal transduction histidine kinase